MTEPVTITRVMALNYKSVAACDVPLGPLAVVVGRNGAGKSNFLDVLRFTADALHLSLDRALRERGGFGEVCHPGSRSRGALRHPSRVSVDGSSWLVCVHHRWDERMAATKCGGRSAESAPREARWKHSSRWRVAAASLRRSRTHR